MGGEVLRRLFATLNYAYARRGCRQNSAANPYSVGLGAAEICHPCLIDLKNVLSEYTAGRIALASEASTWSTWQRNRGSSWKS